MMLSASVALSLYKETSAQKFEQRIKSEHSSGLYYGKEEEGKRQAS